MAVDGSEPPLMATYKHLFGASPQPLAGVDRAARDDECDLPLIDLALLDGEGPTAERCRRSIIAAASEWGFFQVTNHGVPQKLLDRLRDAQVGVFRRPFEQKATERLLDFSPESYRWGTPTATCLEQLSWSEAYHIPIMTASADASMGETRYTVEEASRAMFGLAHQLAAILIGGLGGGHDGAVSRLIAEECTCSTCFLRLNRYPPCPALGGAFGLCPHTDSDFLTILHQDQTGGLQLMKGGRWLTVKPNPNTLIINIGDLFQAWSNNLYRSVEHRVMANATKERFSVAFFLCPSYDTVIHSGSGRKEEEEGAVYRSFTFGEYRQQIREDVRLTGRKIGLPRFLVNGHMPACDQ